MYPFLGVWISCRTRVGKHSLHRVREEHLRLSEEGGLVATS